MLGSKDREGIIFIYFLFIIINGQKPIQTTNAICATSARLQQNFRIVLNMNLIYTHILYTKHYL